MKHQNHSHNHHHNCGGNQTSECCNAHAGSMSLHDEHCHEHHHEHHHGHEHHHHGHEGHHGHEHHHEESPRRQLTIIILSALLLAAAFIVEKTTSLPTWLMLVVYLVPYLLAGGETLKEAGEGIIHGDVFNEHFLMSVATIGALLIGFLPGAETQFPEAVFVMLFFQVGELFEGLAESKSRRSIAHLMDIRPDTATVLHDGKEQVVKPESVAVGDTIVVKPGEKIPVDAVVTQGSSSLDTSALTGESMPRQVSVGDEVLSGCINTSGVIHARTVKSFGQSTVSKVIALVEDASQHKSRSETFITRFARVYTPIVVFAALLLALVPPLISAISVGNGFDFQPSTFNSQLPTWLYRALMFLVVSCPCALVISVPLSFFGGIGGASRHGILIKGANYIDILAKLDTVVFDKTGTLTHGRFAVSAVHPDICDEHTLLHLAAHVEHYSTHPIGAALRDAFPDEATDGCSIEDVEEIAGHGIRATVGGKHVCVGNSRMMESIDAAWHDCGETGTIIHVAIDGQYAGHIVISDQVKDDSQTAIQQLKRLGIKRTVMLTGDRNDTADKVASELGLDEFHAELLPADKLTHINKLKTSGSLLAFVGDGINDAPVLARADVGIAMGGLGSDAAIEAADVVLMDDKPSKISTAISLSRRTLRIARQNVVFAIGIKLLVLILAATGMATMWMAVFADVGVTVLAVLNAMRTLNKNCEY